MAVTHQPIFVQTPRCPKVRISTANTNRDGSGTLGTLFTAGADGAFFKGFRAQSEGNVTTGVVRLYIQSGGAGNFELKKEFLIPTTTPSSSIEAASAEWYPTGGITLDAGDVVAVSTNNAETYSCWLEGGGDY